MAEVALKSSLQPQLLNETVESKEDGESLVVIALVILQIAVVVDEVDFHVRLYVVEVVKSLGIILFREIVVFQ